MKEGNGSVKTRFAPSPTGFLHIGGLRTALYAYLIAKKSDGKFILRIEDTDQAREVEGAIEKILLDLDWARINPNEGVVLAEEKIIQKGDSGPYIQSERLKIYQEHVEKLLHEEHAYYCFCTPDRLDKLRKEQQKNKQAPMYDGACRSLSKEEVEKRIKNGEKYVVRLKIPENEIIEFKDKVFGKIKINSSTIDDQVLLKSDGFPTYHLAVVVDDHLMGVTHITRGEDWLPSVSKHILLYNFFGWDIPEMIHLPTIRSVNGKKLSKREGDVSVESFKKKGYLPEALINFIALLGWNPKTEEEHFTLEELVEKFDISGLHKAGAVFDYKKLDWTNAHYIKQKSVEELLNLCKPFFEAYFKKEKIETDDEKLKKILIIEQERIKKLSEITENIDFYFLTPGVDKKMLRWKNMTDEELKKYLERAEDVVEKIEENVFVVEKLQEALFEEAGDDRGSLLWPLRVALTGKEKSPSPFEVAWVIGKEETILRIKKAIRSIG